MPFGLSCVPEMFQRIMVRIFGDIPGVYIYFDDILIGAKNLMEHDNILRLGMQRTRDNTGQERFCKFHGKYYIVQCDLGWKEAL